MRVFFGCYFLSTLINKFSKLSKTLDSTEGILFTSLLGRETDRRELGGGQFTQNVNKLFTGVQYNYSSYLTWGRIKQRAHFKPACEQITHAY